MTSPINQSPAVSGPQQVQDTNDFTQTEKDLGGRFEIIAQTHTLDYGDKTVDKWAEEVPAIVITDLASEPVASLTNELARSTLQ